MQTKSIVIDRPLVARLASLETLLASSLFLLPLVIGGPQWLVGTLVNAFLFISVVKLGRQTLFLLAMLPSLGAFSHGVLFGPWTFILIYFMPFIWLGNWLMMQVFSLRFSSLPVVRLIPSAVLKACILFIIANLYVRLGLVPKIFVTSMGIIQFITAMAGGILALSILKLVKSHE